MSVHTADQPGEHELRTRFLTPARRDGSQGRRTARYARIWRMVEYDSSVAVLRKYTWGLDLAGLNASRDPGAPGEAGSGGSDGITGAGGIGGLLAARDNVASKSYTYFFDGNGNAVQMIDIGNGSGATIVKYEYDAYGNLTSNWAGGAGTAFPANNPWKFSTKYWDAESGVGYLGYRYYSPKVGRWMSRDPIGEGSFVLCGSTNMLPLFLVTSIGAPFPICTITLSISLRYGLTLAVFILGVRHGMKISVTTIVPRSGHRAQKVRRTRRRSPSARQADKRAMLTVPLRRPRLTEARLQRQMAFHVRQGDITKSR